MRQDDILDIATRLSYGESPASVFADLRHQALASEINVRDFIKSCDTALMVFHVPYEIKLKGAAECTRLARACIDELQKHADIFDKPGVRAAKPYGADLSGGFPDYIAGSFARIIGSHMHYLKTDAEKLAAVKFTLRTLRPYDDILEHTFENIASHCEEGKPETEAMVSMLERASAEVADEYAAVPPPHVAARPHLRVVDGKGVSL